MVRRCVIMMRLARHLVAFIVLALLAAASGLVAESVLAARKLDPILEDSASRIERHWPAIEEDLRMLGGQPFFRQERGDREAGPFLNPLSSWGGAEGQRGELEERLDALPEALEPLAGDEPDPDRVLAPEQVAALRAIDFGWMRRLGDYGHWSLLAGGPAGQMDPLSMASLPQPDYGVLRRWAKLRLYRGVVDGDVASAGREVLDLAWLCLSTESLVGALVGSSVASTAQRMDPSAPVREEDIARIKRVFWASPAFASWAAPGDARARFEKVGREHLPLAVCTAWSEGAFQLLLRPLLEDRFGDFYAELDSKAPGAGCRHELLLRARAQAREDPLVFLEDVGDPGIAGSALLLARMPIARGIVGVFLASIAQPDWLRHYGSTGCSTVPGGMAGLSRSAFARPEAPLLAAEPLRLPAAARCPYRIRGRVSQLGRRTRKNRSGVKIPSSPAATSASAAALRVSLTWVAPLGATRSSSSTDSARLPR